MINYALLVAASAAAPSPADQNIIMVFAGIIAALIAVGPLGIIVAILLIFLFGAVVTFFVNLLAGVLQVVVSLVIGLAWLLGLIGRKKKV